MTHLLVSVGERWPRCPECGCIATPFWPADHRPGCPMTDTDPNEWSTT